MKPIHKRTHRNLSEFSLENFMNNNVRTKINNHNHIILYIFNLDWSINIPCDK